jgi:hypothetical protein
MRRAVYAMPITLMLAAVLGLLAYAFLIAGQGWSA